MAQTISVLGIDLAKLVFHVVGMEDSGHVVLRKRMARSAWLAFIVNLPPLRMGMEGTFKRFDLPLQTPTASHGDGSLWECARLGPMCSRAQKVPVTWSSRATPSGGSSTLSRSVRISRRATAVCMRRRLISSSISGGETCIRHETRHMWKITPHGLVVPLYSLSGTSQVIRESSRSSLWQASGPSHVHQT